MSQKTMTERAKEMFNPHHAGHDGKPPVEPEAKPEPKVSATDALVHELCDKGRKNMGQSGHPVYTLTDSTVANFLAEHGVKPPTVQ